MVLKRSYKQTELGLIPEDWDVVTLGEIGQCVIGLTYKPNDVSSDGLLVLRSSNIEDGNLVFDDNVYVKVSVSENLIVKKGDILICVRNGSRRLIGKCALITDKAEGMTFGAFMSLFRTEDPNYIYYQFQSDLVKRQIDENIGATINQITNANLNSFKIPLPRNKDEQDAIATVLSDIDALLASLDALIAKKRLIQQGAMQELLTGKRRLPGFSGEWRKKRLGNECELITKGTTPTTIGMSFAKHGINFVKIESISDDGNIKEEKLAFIDEKTNNILKRSQLREGDILFSIAGALGRTAMVKNEILPANTNQALAIIRLKSSSEFDSNYLLDYLCSPCITRHIETINVQAAQANLSLENIRDFEISYPSMQEQIAIAAIISEMKAEIHTLEQQRDKTQLLKQGMMQELLTGRTRLV